jgi:hypothetical protein
MIQELRLGNILYGVTDNNEYIQIKIRGLLDNGEITFTSNYTNRKRSRRGWHVEGIKLTECILFKCGLGRDPMDHTKYFFPNVRSTYFLKEENGLYSFCINDCGKIIHTMRSFEYLHQLQNAYFVTYHEELKIPFPL